MHLHKKRVQKGKGMGLDIAPLNDAQ